MKESRVNPNHCKKTDFLLTQDKLQRLLPEEPKHNPSLSLEFTNMKKLTFVYFLKQISLFSANYFFLLIPVLTSYMFYNFQGDPETVEVIGACYITTEFFFSLSIDFQEGLGIVLGPLFSAGQYTQYSRSLWKMAFLCFVITALCSPLVLLTPYLFELLGVDSSIQKSCFEFCVWYTCFVIPTYTLSNFSKGLIGVHQLQKYNLYVNLGSFVVFICLLVPLIFLLEVGYFGFIIAYSSKFLFEFVINLIIISKKSNLNISQNTFFTISFCRHIRLPQAKRPAQESVAPVECGLVLRPLLLRGVRGHPDSVLLPAHNGPEQKQPAAVQHLRPNRLIM